MRVGVFAALEEPFKCYDCERFLCILGSYSVCLHSCCAPVVWALTAMYVTSL